MTYNKAYGSLDNYRLCNKQKREGWGVRKAVLAAVFFAACLYFAMMVMSAMAATPSSGQDKTTHLSSTNRLGLIADPCLPLLRRVIETRSAAAQSSHAREPSVPLPEHDRAAGAVIALGLVFGARYALKPYTLTDRADTIVDANQEVPPLPLSKPARSPALSVAAYRACKKQAQLNMLHHDTRFSLKESKAMR